MWDTFVSIVGVLLTITLIVGIHEYGHFITARLLGVRVLRFSIGFGKTLLRYQGKKGTEYVLAAIPLGGYVKMLDETEGDVPADQVQFAFNRQPLYKKTLIVLAGPLFNFIFAFLLYWIVFIVGFNAITPIIGKVAPDSIASLAGLKPEEEILQIENKATSTWSDIVIHILTYFGDDKQISLQTITPDKHIKNYMLNLNHWQMDALRPDPLTSLGITPYEPEIPAVIKTIMPDTPAANSTLKVGDKILVIQGKEIKDWFEAITLISQHPDQLIQMKISRAGKKENIAVQLGSKEGHGFLGISPDVVWPKNLIRRIQYDPLQAIWHAKDSTIDFTLLNFIFFQKMLTGKVSVQSLGGPITIFESAGSALNVGILPFFTFLAFLSIAIGAINLLPIPGLDGGHLLFYLIEVIIRRPLTVRWQLLLIRIGFIVLILLMIQALVNDILRL